MQVRYLFGKDKGELNNIFFENLFKYLNKICKDELKIFYLKEGIYKKDISKKDLCEIPIKIEFDQRDNNIKKLYLQDIFNYIIKKRSEKNDKLENTHIFDLEDDPRNNFYIIRKYTFLSKESKNKNLNEEIQEELFFLNKNLIINNDFNKDAVIDFSKPKIIQDINNKDINLNINDINSLGNYSRSNDFKYSNLYNMCTNLSLNYIYKNNNNFIKDCNNIYINENPKEIDTINIKKTNKIFCDNILNENSCLPIFNQLSKESYSNSASINPLNQKKKQFNQKNLKYFKIIDFDLDLIKKDLFPKK